MVWSAPSPDYAPHLCGARMRLEVEPASLVAPRKLSAVHGAVLTLLGEQHDGHRPSVALRLGDGGALSLWWDDLSHARAMAGRTESVRIGAQRGTFRFGQRERVRAPPPVPAGRYEVLLVAHSPINVRNEGGTERRSALEPNSRFVEGSLRGLATQRLGLRILPEHVSVLVMQSNAEARRVRVGGHWGCVRDERGDRDMGAVTGDTGVAMLECNAVGLWLLQVAETIGLGGRVGLGFGHIELREVAPMPVPEARRWYVSAHAVERFREKTGYQGPPERARELIEQMCAKAHYVKHISDGAQQLWRGAKPHNDFLIVQEDRDLLTVITINPANPRWQRAR